MKEYLQPSYFIDSDSEIVKSYYRPILSGNETEMEMAIKLFYHVRDGISYDPYRVDLHREALRASSVIQKGYGFCITKAILLTAVYRSAGLPARPGFADVKNHLNSKRLREVMKTDVFIFHGYTEVLINGKWFKLTPAFDKKLCEKAGVIPLDFDGTEDAIFHPFDVSGKKHMEYIRERGSFIDLPYEEILDEYEKYYPHIPVKMNLRFAPEKYRGKSFEEEVEKHS